MKRSEINAIIKDAMQFADKFSFRLPPFADWTPADWATKGHECDEIRDNMLGWDITDYGLGNFDKVGLVLVTIRNGNQNNPNYEKPYAEKLLISQEDQVCPMHFHWKKMEDIINRGGGNLLIQMYNSTEDGEFADTPVLVSSDGRNYEIPAGGIVRLTPGESITLKCGQYHKFWGEPGCGRILVGEVSKVNDDRVDNRFYEPTGRFPEIEEDEAPLYLLGNEYPASK